MKKFSKVYENVEGKNKPKTIVFTDVVQSSKLWSDDPITMDKQLSEHFKLVDGIAKKYNGFVVKTIGDAFMVYFESNESILDAIKFSIMVLKKEKLNLRVGISSGDMEERTYNIQNSNLRDFFGNTVNSASRLESKVSQPGGFAFAYESISDELSEKVKKLIDNFKYEKIEFSSNCEGDKEEIQGKRSGRLLYDIQISKCTEIQKLKGIKELTAYSVKVK